MNGVHEVITDEGRMQQAHNGDYGRQTVSVGSQIRKKETSRTSRASQAHCISFRDIAEIPLSSGKTPLHLTIPSLFYVIDKWLSLS